MTNPAILRRNIRAAAARVGIVLARFSAAALPNRCALCGNLSHRTICDCCDDAYWNEARLRCPRCALPLPGARGAMRYRCGACARMPPRFDATLALADYRAPLDSLALDLKFRARLALGREFGERLARLATDALDGAPPLDVIAPVPLARRRLAERGYNQAWAIARPLARALKVRADATLIARVADTAPQSRLALDARRANVAAAFDVARPVAGWHIGVVDDVMTSGATLDALARKLKDAGARRVTNFVALRTAKD
ncbi:ComF family protein [Burkholderia thailandensis]|uniref:ComF family protein n=2 Tax=Burkholderia thailandensis TaxID=57975 RepID=Q2T1G8_BURTA|nr:ComF family protein [Burkholderia thailandensis]ABC39118.1 ComF family protein [Burkholderia thailandensis E264]AHI72432.1 phosphoribosyl transferase domain protein [Burkholderia thailandensis 2002721723]AHI79976.1 phosphoribosyl transferase domain protein [Burkholderia thailandensis E444]AIC88004.1 phosphoribosyl transferase domain protein [Burkholderia thailandensis USAMRU Malaysia \